MGEDKQNFKKIINFEQKFPQLVKGVSNFPALSVVILFRHSAGMRNIIALRSAPFHTRVIKYGRATCDNADHAWTGVLL